MHDVDTLGIELHPYISLEMELDTCIRRHGFSVLFSGSGKTLAAVRSLPADGIEIIDLGDDDMTPPRSREIRELIEQGDEDWKTHVSDAAIPFLSNPGYRQRLLGLDEGNKRPWTTKEQISSTRSRDRR